MITEEYNILLKDIENALLKNRDQEVLRLTQRLIKLENEVRVPDPNAKLFNALEEKLKIHKHSPDENLQIQAEGFVKLADRVKVLEDSLKAPKSLRKRILGKK